MSALSKLGEARIDEAIASGELTPPPAGTVLDLEAYFQAPVGWRSGFAMLKGHGETVTIVAHPARDGTAHLGYILKITYPDGKIFQFSADPTAEKAAG